MKRTRYISLIIALLSVLSITAQQQQSQYALYNYRNDGDFNAWLNIDIDSITYSCIGIDSIEYDNIVTQEVWTPDSCYRIPLEVIDSIGFRAPEPVLRDGIFYLREYHAAHTNAIDSLTIYFDSSISQDSLPAINQKVLSLTPTYPYEGGFAGRVVRITNIDSGIEVECERVDIADIFSHLILVGKAVSVDESPTTPKSGRRDFSFDNEDMGTIQFTINSDFEKSLFNGIYTVKTKKPKVTCGYYVYVDELFYKISADAYIRHDDLSHTIKIDNDILQRLDTETYALLYELMNNDSMDEDEFKEMDKKLMELAWKKKVPLFEIPVGPVVFKLEFCPMVKLNGRVEASYQYSTKAIQHIGFEASGSTVAAVLNPYTVSLGILKNMNHTYVEDKSSANQKFGLAFNGSFTLGASLKLSACLWTEKVLRVSVAGEGGLKLTGTIDVNFDTADFDSEEDDMYNFPLWYGLTKDTKANAKLYAKISGEVGATPSDFFTLKGDIEPESWQEDLGTVYLFPHFTKPSLPYKYEMGEWEYSPLTLHSTPSNDLMLSCDLGMIMTDSNKNRLFYTPQKEEYKKQEEWYEKYGDISISVARLDPGTYYCYPAFKLWGDKFWKAGPYAKIDVPEPMSISTNSEVLPKGKTVYVNINGGWGYYSASSSNSSICTAEIVKNGQYQVKIVTSKSMTGPATVTVKDLRAGTTETILVTVSDEEPVDEPIETFTVNGVSFTMIPVEGGTFQMGSDDSDAMNSEKPVHQVTLSSFSIGETEVTQELWQAVMGNNPACDPGENKPVEWVSWNDCQVFISKLNTLTGRVFRLPTEAEWEFAARGGNKSKGYNYAGNNNIELVAWYNNNSDDHTHPVAQKLPNELGIYDMIGNVKEFCQDLFNSNYYSISPSQNPPGPDTYSSNIPTRSCRGGSCFEPLSWMYVWSRDNWGDDSESSNEHGLRLVLSKDGDTPDPGNHEWVDLGLPSGTLWATCNVGANSPEEYGDYFAWGETEPKSEYNWSTYFDTEDDGDTFKKYNNDGGLTELLPEDDAATANWGSGWQMPGYDQIKELINSEYTTTIWTTQNGVEGRKVTSKTNGKSIFLPAAGVRWDFGPLYAGYGYFWSRTLVMSRSAGAYSLGFDSRGIGEGAAANRFSRVYGESVRPVRVIGASDIPTGGLVAYYPFNGNANDESGNGYHATPCNSYKYEDGIMGGCISVEGQGVSTGSGGHVMLPEFDFDASSGVTLSLWVKALGLTYYHGEMYINFGDDYENYNKVYIYQEPSWVHFQYHETRLTVPYLGDYTGNWVMYALTCGNDGKLKAYINGDLVGEENIDYDGQINQSLAALGRHWFSPNNSTRFNGSFDEVRIYNRALTSQEVRALYEEP